ncbi:MAG: DUF1501 domain-containing protein [Verrucomicrobiae bacterium]|nr:DUF1501 domain-containing protein [Verrucomicrobiae bacterium]
MTHPHFLDPLAGTRRYFLKRGGGGIGALALGGLLNRDAAAVESHTATPGPHFSPKAKRIIYLFQSGGPSQLDLYDYKPGLRKRFGEEIPTSIYPAERKTRMSADQASFATAPSKFEFAQHGQSGIWMSELLPGIASIADELCVVRSMFTQAINHDPAITLLQTGSQIAGRPSMGAWLDYGLGTENADLPAFVAMSSRGNGRAGQPLYDRLWGAGFLPARHQGVKLRNQGSPVLDIANPPGVSPALRRRMLDTVVSENRHRYDTTFDPQIIARIAQYELAYRMQTSVPALTDLSSEPESMIQLYGKDARTPGTYAYNCLMARRLAENGVPFIQLFHQGWDQHGDLPKQIAAQCADTDRATAALVTDLKQRGMLDDTLIIWGGEFGRTVYSQGKLTTNSYGRDHHPGCFTMWMAGGGIKPGHTYGETDDFSVSVARDPVDVNDLHATILHLMGIQHERLTFPHQGRDFRLTDVAGEVVKGILA